MAAFFLLHFFRDKRQPKDPFTLSADWNFKGESKTDGKEREGQGGVQAMRSLFRKTLEATGNSTLHFSCQTPAGLMACSQQVVRQRDGVAGPKRGRSADQDGGRHHSGGYPTFFSKVDHLSC